MDPSWDFWKPLCSSCLHALQPVFPFSGRVAWARWSHFHLAWNFGLDSSLANKQIGLHNTTPVSSKNAQHPDPVEITIDIQIFWEYLYRTSGGVWMSRAGHKWRDELVVTIDVNRIKGWGTGGKGAIRGGWGPLDWASFRVIGVLLKSLQGGPPKNSYKWSYGVLENGRK